MNRLWLSEAHTVPPPHPIFVTLHARIGWPLDASMTAKAKSWLLRPSLVRATNRPSGDQDSRGESCGSTIRANVRHVPVLTSSTTTAVSMYSSLRIARSRDPSGDHETRW